MTAQLAVFKSDRGLARARLSLPVKCDASSPAGAMWNRIGGFLSALAARAGIDPEAALAVWMVECGGLPFRRGRPVLRFEAHVFFTRWGREHEEIFDAHFSFGGRSGVEGARWQKHRFREANGTEWLSYHGDQALEYRALALAERLAGREVACQSASVGGPQIMGFNHAVAGYGSAVEMFGRFAASERWQICAFFDFCAANGLLSCLRASDWPGFARVYNGPGNADAYEARIAAAYGEARSLLHP